MPGGIHPPLQEIATWPTPNYSHPGTQPKILLVLSCILGPISIALLFARLWVRVHMQRNAGLDDWLMLATLIPVTALTIFCPLLVERYQFNRHIWDVEPTMYVLQRKFTLVTYVLFLVASGFVKLSALLFYRRLSARSVSPTYRFILRIAILSVIGHTVAFALVAPLFCMPISAFWKQVDLTLRFRPGGYQYKCINEGADLLANGIISTVQDFVGAFLPILICWNLQIPIRQRIALYGIFALSYTTVAIGAMRTYTGYRIFFQTYDVTWMAGEMWMWTSLELHIGCMCANAPALKVFFAHLWESERFTSWTRYWSQTRSNNSHEQRSHPSHAPQQFNSFQHLGSSSGGNSNRNSLSKPPVVPEYTEIIISDIGNSKNVEMGHVASIVNAPIPFDPSR